MMLVDLVRLALGLCLARTLTRTHISVVILLPAKFHNDWSTGLSIRGEKTLISAPYKLKYQLFLLIVNTVQYGIVKNVNV